jgi:hypothetical protein
MDSFFSPLGDKAPSVPAGGAGSLWPARSFSLPRMIKTWLNSAPNKPTLPANEPEPYLLVLLAANEVAGGRYADAETLIEAAYEAYDQWNLET